MDAKALARKHLETRLAPLRNRPELARPPRGWIRAIRDAYGMTTRQLAKRLGKSQSVIVEMEKGEARDSLTLGSLRQAAEALDCTLVYALVPNAPIEELRRIRARQIAAQRIERASHSMALENQSLGSEAQVQEQERLTEDLLRGSPARLWDEES
ncbi:transcriptional regulator [Erythrobacter sp. Dej080120_24]|jgi:predicted DNA-binding mobile mystery protein A|uniref:mobile mystery protein A n=1 Tax=Erythrobacter sp. Dej080120_24 TaxID=3024837 RepID=UPI002924DE85|nr:transcriptional regulator [Erythrobacter sp. Dej080120_24]